MYADDLVIMSLSIDDLQVQVNNLNEYCIEWGLEINKSKTKVMVYAKYGHKKPNKNIFIGNETLEWVTSYKYLGIELHNNGNMNASSKHLVNRSWKAIYLLNSTFKQIDLKTTTRLKFFDSMVAPILKNNNEVWGSIMYVSPLNMNDMNFWEKIESLPFEKMHLRYMKIILGTHSKSTNAAVRGELGRYPIGIYIVKNMLKFWNHICDEQYYNPFLKGAAEEWKDLIDVQGSWMCTLKQIFDIRHQTLNVCIWAF